MDYLLNEASYRMTNEDYDQTLEILDVILKKVPKNYRANLYKGQVCVEMKEYEDAIKYFEEARKVDIKTFKSYNLLGISYHAIKQYDKAEICIGHAKYIADVDKQAAKLFDLWQYNFYLAHFQLYSTTKNKAELIKILLLMLESLTKKWDINSSPLYQHIKTKEVDNKFTAKLQKTILQSIGTDKDTEFLKDTPELKELIRKIDIK